MDICRHNSYFEFFRILSLYIYILVHLLQKPCLKVGSCHFKGIIILLIYFLNCQKALFTKK